MRNLMTSDIFAMSKILKKMELKIDADNKTREQLGADLILQIGENLHLAQKEINDFLASLVGIDSKEFSELPIVEALKYIEEFKNLNGVSDFLKLAAKLTT